MKFERIEIDTFGAFGETVIDGLSSRLNVIYGPNGAGKTTLLHFLRGLHCGYSDARRLGLLGSSGQVGGGAVEGRWKGDTCRFQRSAADGDESLRATLVRNGLQTPLQGFSSSQLPKHQIPLLYTVAYADLHAIDKLIASAIDDGIELVAPDSESVHASRADAEELARRKHLEETLRNRIAHLTEQRRGLLAEWQQLKAWYDERSLLAREAAREHQAEESRVWRQRVDWLHSELQSVETDLREAEDRLWQRDDTNRFVARKQPPLLRLRRAPRTDHVAVHHTAELDAIDRRVAQIRRQLADLAHARLDVNLRTARIAGAPSLSTDALLPRLRESLKLMEDELLDLQEDGHRLQSARDDNRCVCDKWASRTRGAVDDLMRRLYDTCEHVSQFELQHLRHRLEKEAVRIDEKEQAHRLELQSLEEKRERLLEATGHVLAWKGSTQRSVEQELCQCSEHPDGTEDRSPAARPAVRVATWRVRPQPTSADLARLRQRRTELRHALEEARIAWRSVRSRTGPLDLPEDVRSLERQAARKLLELDAVEQSLSDAHQQQCALSIDSDRLQRDSEQKQSSGPQCIRWASAYLARLTAGRYNRLRVTTTPQNVLIVDAGGAEFPWRTVSRGLLAQLALSLRLALVRTYAERGIRFPLVLDDVLVDCDQDRLKEAAALLKDFSEQHDQQIIYLTCGTHVANQLESQGATLIRLPSVSHLSARHLQPSREGASWRVQGWVDVQPQRTVSTPDAPQRTASPEERTAASVLRKPESGESLAAPLDRRQPGGPYWLSAESSLLEVPSIGEQMGRRLTAIGIRTIAELLELTAEESLIPLRTLHVDPSRLREWQAEAHLLTCVPDLTGPDAQLLVACGIADPHQLAECDVAQLLRRLERLARRSRESQFQAGQPTREDLQRWIHSARRSRSLQDARGQGQRTRVIGRESRAVHRVVPSSVKLRPSTSHASDSPGADRAVVGRVVPASDSASRDELKFYLSPESPVVDAPSIGPKMAARLHKQGINTVADLLAREPSAVAERLRQRRVSADTVSLWQRQARLMCRIPQLRGHDVQVLVACDLTEPEQVACLDPRTLFGIVGPFVETTEGQRLLRSSKSPDLEEVTDWIQWANQARPLKAA